MDAVKQSLGGRYVQHSNRWLVAALIIAGLQLSACQQKPDTSSKSKPATVERVQGTNLSRVILSARAAERLDIKTAPVRDAQVVRKRKVGGEVVALPAAQVADRRAVWVRVPLSRGDLRKVARGQPARVLPLARDDEDDEDDGRAGLTAQPVDDDDAKRATTALHYVVDSAEHRLVPGQRVRVRLPLSGSKSRRKVVPYAAVLYDAHGDTWVYTNPEPLIFVRHRISVDYIDGDLAVLSDGPPSGTAVVTVGAAELFGTEFEIGK